MKPERVPLPVERAAADPARPLPLEEIWSGAAGRVAIEVRQRGPPGILAPEVAPNVLATPLEVVAGTRLEDNHADATPRQLQRQDPAGGPGPDDAHVGCGRLRLARRARTPLGCSG